MTEMNRYANGKIYMIESPSAGLCYYGSTCLPLHKRLHAHKRHHKNFTNGIGRCITSFKILENEDYKIVLVEEYPCENKQQLLARESHYIRTNECVNKCIPDRTRKQYREDNQEILAEKAKQYHENNKETVANRKKQHYQNNLELMRQRREDGKEKRKQTIVCICGSHIQKYEIARHERTSKHIEFIKSIPESDLH